MTDSNIPSDEELKNMPAADLASARQILDRAEALQAGVRPPLTGIVTVHHTNKSNRTFIHGPLKKADGTAYEYRLAPGASLDVPAEVAEIWLTHTHYGAAEVALTRDQVSPAQSDLGKQLAILESANAAKDSQNVELTERLKQMEKMVADLQATQGAAPVVAIPDPANPADITIKSPAPKKHK